MVFLFVDIDNLEGQNVKENREIILVPHTVAAVKWFPPLNTFCCKDSSLIAYEDASTQKNMRPRFLP